MKTYKDLKLEYENTKADLDTEQKEVIEEILQLIKQSEDVQADARAYMQEFQDAIKKKDS